MPKPASDASVVICLQSVAQKLCWSVATETDPLGFSAGELLLSGVLEMATGMVIEEAWNVGYLHTNTNYYHTVSHIFLKSPFFMKYVKMIPYVRMWQELCYVDEGNFETRPLKGLVAQHYSSDRESFVVEKGSRN
ncbi:hypothetical protein LSTR_LSTR009866 [Laodelphax striatellus]|uniref:Uncharacterized protein n=1 Tax=Laodelphax striatellus TaxID=195883 RepID=A0A482WGY0_LAOST|nr:hypothetical protein LSTR_LSTR009866 [Laodelphax striatellus]